jgi:hypothetical protein
VRTSVIVEVDIAAQRPEAVAVGAIGPGVGPLVEQGADEAFSLAIGLRPEGPGPLVADRQPGQGVAIGVAAIAGAVVGEHALDPDTDLGEAGDSQFDRPRGALTPLIGDRHHHRVAAGVVDEHLEMVIAPRAAVLRRQAAAEDAPAATVRHAAELLVVLVDERTRMAGHVADRSSGDAVAVVQAVEAGAPQDAVDGRARMTRERRQARRAVAAPGAGPDDRGRDLGGRPARRAVRPRAAILDPGKAVGPIAAHPLVAGGAADAELFGDRRHRPAVDEDPLHQQLTAEDAETRTRMCHESLRPVWVANTPNRARRLSLVNNVFRHHN